MCFASRRALSQLTFPCDLVIVLGPCTCIAGTCWGQLLANQSPLQFQSHPAATQSQVVAADSHTRGWSAPARTFLQLILVPSDPPRHVLGDQCRFTSPSSFFVWPSMPRLTPNWAISTFADLQSTMSNQRWASPLVLSPIPSMPLDSKPRLWGCTLRPALPSVTGSSSS